MIPQIVAALTRAASGMGAAAAPKIGKEMYWDAASGLIKERSLPPDLPQNRKAPSLMDSIAGQVTAGSLLSTGIQSVVNKLLDSFHKLTHPLETFRGGLDKFKDTVTQIPQTVLKAKETIVGIGSAWTEALAAPIKTVKELGDAIGQFTQLSNPAGMKMFQFRVENTFATIGNVLQPILDALTRSAEKMGDMFAKIKPAIEPAIKAIEKLIDLYATRFADAMMLVAPMIEVVSLAFSHLVDHLLLIQAPFTFLIRKITELRRSVLEFLGLPTGFDQGARSDIAIRSPKYTNTEAIQREMAKNSLMASLGQRPENRDVPSLLQVVVRAIEGLPDKLVEKLKDVPLRVINVSKEDVQDAAASSALGTTGLIFSATSGTREDALAEFNHLRRSIFQES